MKKGNTKDYADLLRQLETKRLAKGKHNRYLGIKMERGGERQKQGRGRGEEKRRRDGEERAIKTVGKRGKSGDRE